MAFGDSHPCIEGCRRLADNTNRRFVSIHTCVKTSAMKEASMSVSKWCCGLALALALAFAPRVARAGDDGDDDGQPAASTDHADPSTKTLPSHASDTAKANAFGQQGARMRASHQAARDAAANDAAQAAQHKAAAQARAAAGKAHAHGANSHAERGQATAAAARAGHHHP
jgi:hypothetical protein